MSHTDAFNKIMAQHVKPKKKKSAPAVIEQIKPLESMTPLQASISKCTINGNIVNLPFERLDNYADVRKAFLNAGAKYKNNTFVFPSDAKPYISKLMEGQIVNIKKEFQFFGTPAKLADRLVEMAEIDIQHTVLEPSAGQGALINAIHRVYPNHRVECFELMDTNRAILEKIPNAVVTERDFLKVGPEYMNLYNRIVANPPFNKNQDIDHIYKMYEVLSNKGVIVTIASKHWQTSKNKKETQFREWLDTVNAEILEIPPGEFKESGTKIATVIIKIKKQ